MKLIILPSLRIHSGFLRSVLIRSEMKEARRLNHHSSGDRSRRLLLLIAIVSLALWSIACRGRSQRSPVPRIEWTDLPASIVEKSPDIQTGYLIVPERRFPRPSSRTIKLPFIIMKSRSTTPLPDPVLYTAGGPGGSSLGRSRSRHRNPILEERDMILFEQRGAGFSEPSLLAPAVEEALRSGWGIRLNGDPDPAAVEKALIATRREYETRGIDPAGYTTRESASDIAALRKLMEIESWNLYGFSYSTKLMLTVLRDSPSGVRCAILDSVLPPDANWDEDAPSNILEVFQKVVAAAREDEAILPRIDGLEERFSRFLSEANLRPVEIILKNPVDGKALPIRLDAAGIMNCVYAGLEDASIIPRLPLVVAAACRGETAALAPLAEAYLSSFRGYAWGMRLAVWCNEEFPFERPERILQPAGLPPELSRFVQAAVPVEALSAWPQGRPEPEENEPVRSAVPVLLAAGEFDPDTPVKWTRAAAAHLSNSQVVEFSGMSHVPLFAHPEANRIIKEFLENPRRKVDPGRAGVRPPFSTSLEAK